MLFVGGCSSAPWSRRHRVHRRPPVARLRGDYLAIVTLGFGEILRVMLQRTGGRHPPGRRGQAGLDRDAGDEPGRVARVFGAPLLHRLVLGYLFVTITVVVALHLKFSSYGRAFLSIRENEIAPRRSGSTRRS
jgi:branched-chain amino acid transport system permease protein